MLMRETLNILLYGCSSTERDKKNQRRIIAWSLVWVALWTGVGLAYSKGWLESGPLAVAAALLTVPFGIGTILAYRRFLREADELRRKIELEALALAFGIGLVGGFTYWLLGEVGAIGAMGEVDLLAVMVTMIFTYSVSILVGHWRYR
jgi:hypothetical protein